METKDKPFSAPIEILNQRTSHVLNHFHLGESQRNSATALHFGFVLVRLILSQEICQKKHTNPLLLRQPQLDNAVDYQLAWTVNLRKGSERGSVAVGKRRIGCC